eukprot:CAMPEP_0196663426 /NCGR_PEP_ID=MMETSP1086-20130531/52809_1 /TAXON_ID=77921 /ORGANISM="Cyanoptyche  gloeocystis , Strain SAG4.97" /LENGTH=278 /DNA_ID=CAMNT_0041999235 /DNA_START=147 /DNA_END=983 /DNA_ORIENTATION=+
MTVAEIAWRSLSADSQSIITKLVSAMAQDYPDSNDFMSAACWPDDVKGRGLVAFDQWHFVDNPLIKDDVKGPAVPAEARQNVVWAIQQAVNTLKNAHGGTYEKAFMLRMLLHFVGDVHQPMHCVSLFDKEFPDGDAGGNKYRVGSENLHALWDGGAGMFQGFPPRPLDYKTKEHIRSLADEIIKNHPRSDFKDWQEMDPEQWASESFELAREHAYVTPENQTPSNEYMSEVRLLSQERVALGGYRLAQLLNSIFLPNFRQWNDEAALRLRGASVAVIG